MEVMVRNKDVESFESRPLCNAPTKSGGSCQSRAMRNSTRCRSHGGNTPAAIDAARVRALRQADPLMAKLHTIAFDDTKPPQVQLEAIKHALKVTGAFEAKQSVEIDLIGKPQEKTFMDFVGEALIDVAEDDDEVILDAEVIEDDPDPLSPRDEEPPAQTRSDRAFAQEVERAARGRAIERSGSDRDELLRREREALDIATGKPSQRPRPIGGRSDDIAAMNAQQDREDAELQRVKDAERRLNARKAGPRRARTSEATMSQPRKRGERR